MSSYQSSLYPMNQLSSVKEYHVKNLKRPLSLWGLAITIMALLALVGGSFLWHSSGTFAHAASGSIGSDGPTATVHPLFKPAQKAGPNASGALFTCQLPTASFRCYSPQQVQNAYTISSLLKAGYNGAGQTIVIIDAYQSPTIFSDLALFDATFGLPKPGLHIIAPEGLTPFNPKDPTQVGWAGEITLDVEWAHAVAPGATIDLVLAKNSNGSLERVTRYAVDHNLGSTITQSFGFAEACAAPFPHYLANYDQIYVDAAKKGISVFASAGDEGVAQPACTGTSFIKSVGFPASDPNVTAVGGTQLDAGTGGSYRGEIAWNETDIGTPYNIASGGGFSTVFAQPTYQQGITPGKMRGVPDVAYNASVNGGVLTVLQGAFTIFGGTSAGSPQWAGITALADQYQGHRLGFLNPIVYGLSTKSATYASTFHDITFGNNAFFFIGKKFAIPGYSTRTGWDAVTGLGSPIVSNLVPKL